MRGAIYARYSQGPQQTDQSIEGQVTDCRAYAEREGIDIIEIYADRHISGKSVVGRAEFQRMMYDAEHHRFDCVIVWKIDRFGRNRQDIAVNKMKLKKAGVQLRYAVESVPDGPEGIILESVLEGLAEYYSEDLRQKVTRGIRECAKQGKYCGASVPIGYKMDANRRIIIDEPAAAAVRKAFDMHINGARCRDIVDMMTRAGIVGQRSGKPLTKAAVGRMLRNERYYGKWELAGVPFDVPGLISEETFMEAAKHFKTSRNNAANRALHDYILSGKCYCALCGKLLIAESATGRNDQKYTYYKCGGRKRGSKCKLKPIPQELLERIVLKATTEDMLKDDVIDELTKRILEIQEQDEASEYSAMLKERLADAKKRQGNLLKALEYAPDLKSVAERIQEIEKEIADIETDIAREEIKKPRLTEAVIKYWLNSFRDGDVTDPEFQRKLVETFIARIEVKNGEALIIYNVSEGGTLDVSHTARLVDLTIPYAKPTIAYPFIVLRVKIA